MPAALRLPQAAKPQGLAPPGNPLSSRKADGNHRPLTGPPRYFASLPFFAPPSLIWRSPRSSRTSRDCRKLASCFFGFTAISLRLAPDFLMGFLNVVFITRGYHSPPRPLVLPCPKLGGFCAVFPCEECPSESRAPGASDAESPELARRYSGPSNGPPGDSLPLLRWSGQFDVPLPIPQPTRFDSSRSTRSAAAELEVNSAAVNAPAAASQTEVLLVVDGGDPVRTDASSVMDESFD